MQGSDLYLTAQPQQPVRPFWMGVDYLANERWELIQGDTLAYFIQLYCDCPLVPNITGYLFAFTIKASMDPEDPNILCRIYWVEQHGMCSASALIVPPDISATLPEGRYAFDLKYRTNSGSVQTFKRGEIDILPATDLSLSIRIIPPPREPSLSWQWLWLCLQSVDTPATDDNIHSWLTQGGSLRTKWSSVQPTKPTVPTSDPNDPSYNWSYFDSEIGRWTAANKLMLLRIIMQGTNAPQWLYDLPGMQSYIDANGDKIWIWTDPIVTPYLNAMLDAFGARYGSNKNIVIVASDITSVTSGDFAIPHQKLQWHVTSNFNFPKLGGTSTAIPVPNTTGLVVGQQTFINTYGFVRIVEIIGPPTNPTGVVLQNMDLVGNRDGGVVGFRKVMYLDDTQNLLSSAYNFDPDAVAAAQVAVITRLRAGFPNAVITYSCGRTSSVNQSPPTLTPTPDSLCTQIANLAFALHGSKFAIEKNQLNAVSPIPPGINSNFYIFTLAAQVQRAFQMTWFTFGDPTFRNNRGHEADPLTVLTNAFNTGLQWGPQWLELYAVDDSGLRSQWVEPPSWGIWTKKWFPASVMMRSPKQLEPRRIIHPRAARPVVAINPAMRQNTIAREQMKK